MSKNAKNEIRKFVKLACSCLTNFEYEAISNDRKRKLCELTETLLEKTHEITSSEFIFGLF